MSYSPTLSRFMQTDPEQYIDGPNMYQMEESNPVNSVDPKGTDRYITNWGTSSLHCGIAVDTWEARDGKWVNTGQVTFDFSANSLLGALFMLGTWWGHVEENPGIALSGPIRMSSNPCEDQKLLEWARAQVKDPPFYNGIFYNCVFWSVGAVQVGMGTPCSSPPCNAGK